jgi:hypothetical protein
MHPLFVPECHADTALMLTLLRENAANEKQLKAFVNHQHGIGNVSGVMQAQWEEFKSARRVVGLVDLDEDFGKDPYLRLFTRVLGGSMERKAYSHALLQHASNSTHYLVVLNPVFERWLEARAVEIGSTMALYGLPTKPSAFKRYSRVEGKKPGSQLRQLLNAIATARHPAYAAPASFIAAVMHLDGPLP